MKNHTFEMARKQTFKRLAACIVAVAFGVGSFLVPAETLAVEPSAVEPSAAETPAVEAAEAETGIEDLVRVKDETGSAAAVENLDEEAYDGFLYKLREDVTKKEVNGMEQAIESLGEEPACGEVAPVIDRELYAADSLEAIREVADAGMIEYIEPDYTVSLMGTNDQCYPSHGWFLDMIKAPEVWAKGSFGKDIVVAVLDTGVIISHPDFENTRFTDPYNALDDSEDVTDTTGHGTGMAGIIAASYNNGKGLTGIMPQAAIMPVKVIGSSGTTTYSMVIKGLNYAVEHGADVVNMSLGDTNESEAMEEACAQAAAKGVILVASSGNDGLDSTFYPASYSSVISVGSIERDGEHSDFSTYNEFVDAVAPGRGILLTSKQNGRVGYFTMSGTSTSGAQVAAMAVMVKELDRSVDSAEFKEILSRTCIDKGRTGWDEYFGYGLIDLDRAYRYMTETFSMYQASLSCTKYVFNGKAKNPSVTLKKGKTILAKNEYNVIYPSGRKAVGTYKVKITGQGIYNGTKTCTFIINPPLVKKLKAPCRYKTKLKVKWYAMSDKQKDKYRSATTGFQVRVSKNAKFKNARYIKVKGISKTSVKVKGLKRKTTYYVQYRAYKKVGTKTYYSKWSNTKKAKTK